MSPNGSAPRKMFSLPAAIAATAAGIVAMAGGAGFLAAQQGLGMRAVIAVGTLALALPSAAALALRPDWWPTVQGAGIAGRTVGLSMLLGAALWLASAGLMEVQSLAMPPPPEYLDAFRAIHAALAPKNALDALVSVLVIALLPGVCEELVMRGVLLPSLAQALRASQPVPAAADAGHRAAHVWLGAWVAIVISALLFAGIHYDRYRFLFTLVLGLVFYLGMGLLGRMMPQLQVFFVAMPATIWVGLGLLALLLTMMMGWYLTHFENELAIFRGA